MSKQNQVSTGILSLELITPDIADNRPVYITGNFCKWLPDLEQFRMTENTPGKYIFHFPKNLELPEIIEYKYTRGGWDQSELGEYGENAPNRQIINKSQKWFVDVVPYWQERKAKTDFLPLVEDITEQIRFDSPVKSRRIRLLLPYDYYSQPKRHYPVLYLTDGQNLTAKESGNVSWDIEKQMARLAKDHDHQIIIVAIDHGGEERAQELSPYNHPKFGTGKGQDFLRFLTRGLKPFIDKNYRTQKNRLQNGIGGSSMGGLFALYAGLMHPELFGKLLVFSPSLWVSEKLAFDIEHFFEPFEYKAYFYAGGNESPDMIPQIKELLNLIRRRSYGYEKRMKAQISINKEGDHHESQWSREFSPALQWLFFED